MGAVSMMHEVSLSYLDKEFEKLALYTAEKCIGRKADKNRKIYNGMMKTYFYQFLGKKPPKREKRTEKQGE